MENKKAPKGELEIEEKLKLIFSKAKELCNLVEAMPCYMRITIDSDNFWISQRYDKDVSFANDCDNSNNDGNNGNSK